MVPWASLHLVVSAWVAFMPRYRNAQVEAGATGGGGPAAGKGGVPPAAAASFDDDACKVLQGVLALAMTNLTKHCGVKLSGGEWGVCLAEGEMGRGGYSTAAPSASVWPLGTC